MAIDPKSARWRGAFQYISALPIGEKRRFYARALKFFLDSSLWDDPLRAPGAADHINMREMLLAFNDHNHVVMRNKDLDDIFYQWQIVRPLKRGVAWKRRKKQISRLTGELMKLIRQFHPVGSRRGTPPKARVRCMPEFQKQLKQKYFSTRPGHPAELDP